MKELTYQETIEQYGMFIYFPVGTSMLPLIREGKDSVKLVKIERPVKQHDVVLYQRNDQFILHRVVKVKDDTVDMAGDHQTMIEKDVLKSSIIALMEGVYREERYVPIQSFRMKCYSATRPMVRFLRKCRAKLARLIRRKV